MKICPNEHPEDGHMPWENPDDFILLKTYPELGSPPHCGLFRCKSCGAEVDCK